jgi:large subunit ribosomal protein L5
MRETLNEIKKNFGLTNDLAVPKLKKIVVNVGLGRLSQQPNFVDKILPEIVRELAYITGQRPSPTKAKKSIAGFKLRAGQIVGLKVTLRGKKMSDFLEKIIKVALPRLRDFRGVPLKSVDKSGILNIGFKDHFVFPEINQEQSRIDFGLEVSIVTTAKDREMALRFLRALGIPFEKS